MVSSSSAINPNASAPICNDDASGLRRRLASPYRHVTPRCGRRFNNAISAHADSAAAASRPAMPPTMIAPAFTSCACQPIKSAMTQAPSRYAMTPPGRGRGRSRRNTRSGGAPESDTSGGNAKPNSSSKPVPSALNAGTIPGPGRSVFEIVPSSITKSCCPPRASTMPAMLAMTPSAPNCNTNKAIVVRRRAPETAQHRGGVEMPAQITRCRERDRHRSENHGNQRRKTEILFGAIERQANFGAQITHRFEFLSRFQLGLRPLGVGIEDAAIARVGDQQPVCRAIAWLQQVGRRHIVDIDQQSRSKREQPAGNLGLLLDDGADVQHRIADCDRVAHFQSQTLRQSGIGPCVAAWRNPGCSYTFGMVGIDKHDRAAQRIADRHRP
jgi:hypothetical protein